MVPAHHPFLLRLVLHIAEAMHSLVKQENGVMHSLVKQENGVLAKST
jgi:hypothetical protein